MRETWKPVSGFDGYEISDRGRVRSFRRNNGQGRTLKTETSDRGYKQVSLYKNGKRHQKSIHRLVAEAFIDNPEEKETVNHKDCDKTNNCVSNLEWMSKSENVQHAYDNGLNENVKRRLGEGRSKTHPPVRVIETGKIYRSQRSLARDLGLIEQCVSRCLRKGSGSSGGYHFEYIKE